ncbi:MAG: carboxylesterase/lipase family protein [Bacteroidaceae bacterium]|nr:carboxylesterase/lipase family protein [Bacteroidaceae bacterium]
MKKQLSFFLMLLISLIAGAQNTVVQLTNGQAEGSLSNGIFVYKGIPYAKAKRFMLPESPDTWDGVKKFNEYGQMSSQAVMGFAQQQPNMGDDCQNLNVWTPALKDGGKRPIMVWLHGGGFQSGSANEEQTNGENLSRQGNVVVFSINHRLNILGHLDLSAYGEKYRYSGNAGILDIVYALRWIKLNAAAFGGDPDNITLFGESGGGAKIIVLNSAPAAHGLFQKGIIESGAVESLGMKVTEKEIAREVAETLLRLLEITPERVDELQDFNYQQLNAAGDEALREVAVKHGLMDGFNNPGNMSWAPVVDGDFLIQQPVVDHTLAVSRDVALIIGTNLTEMNSMMMFSPDFQNSNKSTWTETEKQERLKAQYGDKTEAVVAAFRKAYPDRDPIDALYVDSWIRSNSLRYLGLRANEGGAQVYSYMFELDNPMNPLMMAPHTAEIPYVFNNLGKGMMAPPSNETTQPVADAMSQAWINFARTGDPSTPELKWSPFTKDRRATMIFGKKSEERVAFDDDLMKLLVPDYPFMP